MGAIDAGERHSRQLHVVEAAFQEPGGFEHGGLQQDAGEDRVLKVGPAKHRRPEAGAAKITPQQRRVGEVGTVQTATAEGRVSLLAGDQRGIGQVAIGEGDSEQLRPRQVGTHE